MNSSLEASLRSLLGFSDGDPLPAVAWVAGPGGAVARADAPRVGLERLASSLLQVEGTVEPLAVFAGTPTCFAVPAGLGLGWRGVAPVPLADDPGLLAFDVQPGPALLVLPGAQALFVSSAGAGRLSVPVPSAFAAFAGLDAALAPAPWVSAGLVAHLLRPGPAAALRAAAFGVRFYAPEQPAARAAARARLREGRLPEPVEAAVALLRGADAAAWEVATAEAHAAVAALGRAVAARPVTAAGVRAVLEARDDLACDEAAFAVAKRPFPAARALAELDARAAVALAGAPGPSAEDALLDRLGRAAVDRPGAWWPAIAHPSER
jgi:hypothetical protein